jgi:hypothetical protein
VATLDLEFGEHASLGVVGNRTAKEKTFREVAFVIPLEHVFVRDIAEHRDRLVKYGVHFCIGFLCKRSQWA